MKLPKRTEAEALRDLRLWMKERLELTLKPVTQFVPSKKQSKRPIGMSVPTLHYPRYQKEK